MNGIAEITIFSPLSSPARHTLDRELVTVGRATDCTIPIKDRYLSRRHAEFHGEDGRWILKDCGSANGTYLNGTRVEQDQPLKSGDRIRIGDTEIVFHTEHATDQLSVAESKVSATISIPFHELDSSPAVVTDDRALDRFRILNALAMELIEDRPYDELFGYIVDRVMEHMKPSRAAIGLLRPDGTGFETVELRRADSLDSSELTISRTLLSEVVEEKKALAFMDVSVDEKLSRAKSIVAQGIHSVLCAPLTIGGSVAGVLYVDFLFNQRAISEDDLRLVGQIARFAAVKLENTRLREDAIQKRLMDEELRTAYTIQRRLLPDEPPTVERYSFYGANRPCRTVSGDYYDFRVRPDGSVYFVIADVSGKGVTAALPMAGLQSAFRIFTRTDPSPEYLVTELNATLRESLPRSKFITLFAGRLFPETGVIEFTNAGHNPPLIIRNGKVEELSRTDLLLGMFAEATYQLQTATLEPGDILLLFTDGVTECENLAEQEFGYAALKQVAMPLHGLAAQTVGEAVERAVLAHAAEEHLGDDVTLVVIGRNA